jgi:integrase
MRARPRDARGLSRYGERPSASRLKRSRDAKTTFASVAADCGRSTPRQWSADYRVEVEASIRNHLADLDGLPIADITAPIAAPVLRAVEIRAPLMWEKIRSRLRAILDYAVERGDIVGNPLPAMRRGKKRERKHFPAVTDLAGVGAILRAARTTDPCKGIARAHVLAYSASSVEVVGVIGLNST